MSKQVLQQLPDGVYTFEDWQYTQAIILRNGKLSVYVGGTEAARLELGDMRLCKLVEVDPPASVPSDEVLKALRVLTHGESACHAQWANMPTTEEAFETASIWLDSVAAANGEYQ